VFVGLHLITNQILVDTYAQFYFMDWDGVIKSEPVSGLRPVSISNSGKAILCNRNGEIYTYDITSDEEKPISHAGTNLNPRCFSADGNSILLSTNKDHLKGSNSYELYTMDTSGENIIRHTFNEESEFPIGFFQQDTRILYTTHKNDKALYALEF
jgi:Tol biopolymer transport system component